MRTYRITDTSEILSFQKSFVNDFPNCEIHRTNYTLKMKAGKEVHFYTAKMLGGRSFGVFKKIEKSVKNSGIEMPEIERGEIKYFRFANKTYPENFVIVDLSAAYPRSLLNMGYIDEEAYKALMTLPKEARLQVTGMLATQKTVFHIENGIHINTEVKESEFRNVFFAACHTVGELLNECFEKFKKDALFYWVDGIGVKSESAEKVLNFFIERNYPAKLEQVTNCRRVNNTIIFAKDGKRKILFFPKKRKVTDLEILNFLKS